MDIITITGDSLPSSIACDLSGLKLAVGPLRIPSDRIRIYRKQGDTVFDTDYSNKSVYDKLYEIFGVSGFTWLRMHTINKITGLEVYYAIEKVKLITEETS